MTIFDEFDQNSPSVTSFGIVIKDRGIFLSKVVVAFVLVPFTGGGGGIFPFKSSGGGGGIVPFTGGGGGGASGIVPADEEALIVMLEDIMAMITFKILVLPSIIIMVGISVRRST